MNRPMTPAQRDDEIIMAKRLIKALENTPVFTDCMQCLHFQSGYCDHAGQNPPEEFYLKHCDYWKPEVPF